MTRAQVISDARRVADRLSGDAFESSKREGKAIRALLAIEAEQRRQLRACRRVLRSVRYGTVAGIVDRVYDGVDELRQEGVRL